MNVTNLSICGNYIDHICTKQYTSIQVPTVTLTV